MFCLQLGGLLNLLSDFTCGLGTGQHWMISPTVNILVDCYILDVINGLADLIIIWLWIGTSWTRVMQSRQAHKLQAAHRTLAGPRHFSHSSEDLRDTIWNNVEKLSLFTAIKVPIWIWCISIGPAKKDQVSGFGPGVMNGLTSQSIGLGVLYFEVQFFGPIPTPPALYD